MEKQPQPRHPTDAVQAFVNTLNRRLEQAMPALTPLGVILGFIFSRVFITLVPLVPFLFAVMTLSGALKLRFRDLGAAVTDPMPALVFFICSHVLMPLAGFLGGSLIFPDDPAITAGFVLLFSAPTAVSGFIWIAVYRGSTALSLTLILLDTLAAPLVVPGTVSLLLGASVSPDTAAMARSLALMVVVPTILGVILNEASRGGIPRIISPYVSPAAKLCLAVVVAANAAAAAPRIHLGDRRVWLIAVLCVGFSLLGFGLARLGSALARQGRNKGVTLFFAVGLRNITAAATLALAYFPEAAALPAVLGILFQQSMAALMGRLGYGPQSANEV
jgi:predicted Na+-dependent transporter